MVIYKHLYYPESYRHEYDASGDEAAIPVTATG